MEHIAGQRRFIVGREGIRGILDNRSISSILLYERFSLSTASASALSNVAEVREILPWNTPVSYTHLTLPTKRIV